MSAFALGDTVHSPAGIGTVAWVLGSGTLIDVRPWHTLHLDPEEGYQSGEADDGPQGRHLYLPKDLTLVVSFHDRMRELLDHEAGLRS